MYPLTTRINLNYDIPYLENVSKVNKVNFEVLKLNDVRN